MKNATSKKMGELAFKAFVGLTFAINAMLTFMFGGTYGGETFPTAVPILSFILGGLMLTVFYDFASYGWFVARSKDNQSIMQRAIASLLAGASMLASVSVSGIQLAMTTTLVDLSAARSGIGLFGLVLAVLMATAHFLGLFAYRYFDPIYQEQDAEADLQARLASFRLEQKDRVADKMMTRVEQIMDNQVDSIAEGEASMLWQALRTQFQNVPQLPTPEDPMVIDVEAEPPSKAMYQVVRDGKVLEECSDYGTAEHMAHVHTDGRTKVTAVVYKGEVLMTWHTLQTEEKSADLPEEDSPLSEPSQPVPSLNGHGQH